MSDLDSLLDALGPEPPPAPRPASFFALLTSNALGQCSTDPAAIRDRMAGLLEAEGWRLVDRTAECRPDNGGLAFLAPPGPNEITFLARAPNTEAGLAALAQNFPSGHPKGVLYLPVTPATALIGRASYVLIRTLEGAADASGIAAFVRGEERAQADAFRSAGEAYRLWAPLFAARGVAVVDWTGRARAGGTLPVAVQECAFVGCTPGAEADFEEFVWSLGGRHGGTPQFRPVAVLVGREAYLHLADWPLDPDWAIVDSFALHDAARDPEVVRRKVLELLREGWRLTDRTDECRPDDTDPLRLAPLGENELVFLACAPQTAPLFAAVAPVRPPMLAEGATYVQTTPIAILLNRSRCIRIFTEGFPHRGVRFMMDDTPEAPAPWPPTSESSGTASSEGDGTASSEDGSAEAAGLCASGSPHSVL